MAAFAAATWCAPHVIHDQLRSHLSDFLDAYDFARRLKTLSGPMPNDYICKIWT